MEKENHVPHLTEYDQAALLRELLRRLEAGALTVTSEKGEVVGVPDLVESLQSGVRAGRMLSHLNHIRAAQPSLFAVPVHLPKENPLSLEEGAAVALRAILAERPMQFPSLPALRPLILGLPVIVKMKLPMQAGGWAALLMKQGYRVSSRSEHFGRQRHIIKKDGAALILVQGSSTAVQNKLAGLTVEQQGILGALREAGALLD